MGSTKKLIKVGEGLHGSVYLSNYNGVECVIKKANKKKYHNVFAHEIKFMKKLQGCKHVVQMLDYSLDPKFVIISKDTKCSKNSETWIKYERLYHTLKVNCNGLCNKTYCMQCNKKSIKKQLYAALREIHSRGIVHADLKPNNVMFVGDTLKLIDFSCALWAHDLVGDCFVGTLYTQPPAEILGNPLTYKVDYYLVNLMIKQIQTDYSSQHRIPAEACLIGTMLKNKLITKKMLTGKKVHRYFIEIDGKLRFKYHYLLDCINSNIKQDIFETSPDFISEQNLSPVSDAFDV